MFYSVLCPKSDWATKLLSCYAALDRDHQRLWVWTLPDEAGHERLTRGLAALYAASRNAAAVKVSSEGQWKAEDAHVQKWALTRTKLGAVLKKASKRKKHEAAARPPRYAPWQLSHFGCHARRFFFPAAAVTSPHRAAHHCLPPFLSERGNCNIHSRLFWFCTVIVMVTNIHRCKHRGSQLSFLYGNLRPFHLFVAIEIQSTHSSSFDFCLVPQPKHILWCEIISKQVKCINTPLEECCEQYLCCRGKVNPIFIS